MSDDTLDEQVKIFENEQMAAGGLFEGGGTNLDRNTPFYLVIAASIFLYLLNKIVWAGLNLVFTGVNSFFYEGSFNIYWEYYSSPEYIEAQLTGLPYELAFFSSLFFIFIMVLRGKRIALIAIVLIIISSFANVSYFFFLQTAVPMAFTEYFTATWYMRLSSFHFYLGIPIDFLITYFCLDRLRAFSKNRRG